jgi:hypothetical protein
MNEIISSVKQLFNIDIFATEGGLKCLKSDVSNDLIAYLKDNKIPFDMTDISFKSQLKEEGFYNREWLEGVK